MTTEPLLLGIDVGTQSLRAALVEPSGRTVGVGVAPLDTTYPRPTWAEQDPDRWWTAAREAVGLALRSAGVGPERVAGIGLDSTACTVVACRADGTPLRPCLLWMDQRSHAEADAIAATGDPALRYVSGRVSPEWMLPKALWLKRHEPETYAAADRIVECTNWFMFKLTGEWTLSLNHCAVKWNYARPDGGWPLALMDAVGLGDLPEKWPERIEPARGRRRDPLTGRRPSSSASTPGRRSPRAGSTPTSGMIGLGATSGGDVAVIVGSSTCHLAQSEAGVFGSGAAGCYPDATVEGLYTIEAGQTATGSILDWFRRHFAGDQRAEAEARGVNVYEVLDEQAAAVPPGADGPGRPRRLAGEPLALQGPGRPRGDRRPLARPRARPRLPGPLRGDRLRHPADPGGRRGPRPRRPADRSSAAAGRGRPSGCRSTPTSSSGRSTCPASPSPAPSARR